MRRAHRRWHLLAWAILPVALGVLILAALALRPAPLPVEVRAP